MFKKRLFSALGYILLTLFLGYSWHMIWFKQLYESFGVYNRKEPIIALGLVSIVIQGVILSYLYPKFHSGYSYLLSSLKFMGLMGLFFASGTVIALAAKANINDIPGWIGINFAFHFVQFGLVALVFAFVFSREGGSNGEISPSD
jgi:hypothetical protein